LLSSFTEFPVPTPSSFPTGITRGADGNLWFSERQGNKVGRITTNGAISEFPLSSANTRGWGITAGPDGNVWFAAEGDGVASEVGRITPSGAMTLFPVLPAYSYPDVATGPDGNLWVTEGYNNQIAVVSPQGVVLNQFNDPIPGGVIEDIAAGPDGNMWFTAIVGPSGSLGPVGTAYVGSVSVAGNFTIFPLPGTSNSVKAIATGPDGNLWFTEQATNKIGRLTPSGVLTEFAIPTANSNSDSLSLGPDGNLWFVEISTNQIASITPGGVITEYPIPSPNSQPYAIVTGRDGELWFTEGNANQIGRTNFFHETTSTALTAPASPPIFNQPVTFKATVAPSFPNAVAPTGAVTFYDGATQLGQPVPLSGGSATLTTASLAVGQHTIVASYNGDTNFLGSISSASVLVQPGTINLTPGQTPVTAYLTDPVTLTVSAQVLDPYAGDPQATVNFIEGTNIFGGPNVIGSAPLVMSGSTGTATFTTTTLPLGAHSITIGLSTVSGSFVANVTGAQNFSVTIIAPPPTTTTITAPSSQPIAGLPFTLTATVAALAGTRIPTGTVTFYDGAATLGTATLGNGTATASGDSATATLTGPAPAAGSQLVRAVYNGIQGYGISSSLDGRITTVPEPFATSIPLGDVPGQIAVDSAGDLFISDGYTVFEMRPDGSVTTIGSYREPGLAVDSAGDLFIGYVSSTSTGTVSVDERRPDGTTRTVFTTPDGGIAFSHNLFVPVAVDGAGNLFVATSTVSFSILYEVQPNGQTSEISPTIGGNHFPISGYVALAADSAGDVYVACHPGLFKLQSDGTFTPVIYLGVGDSGVDLATDGSGNLFVNTESGIIEVLPDGTNSPLLTSSSSSYNFLGTLGENPVAVDSAGNLYLGGLQHFFRVDMSPNLTVSPLQSSDVQSLLNNQGGSVTLVATSPSELANVLSAVSGLNAASSGSVSVTLAGGVTYQQTDTSGNTVPFAASAPAGVTLTISCPSGNATIYDLQTSGGNVDVHGTPQGTITIVGQSPALTVRAGQVTVGSGVTLVTATNSPTILVSGGSLTLRGATVQESTGSAQAALLVTGGTVDLGSASDPGGNIFNVNGTGALIQNTSGRAIPVVGDTFENNGVANAPSIFVLNPTASGALTVSNNTTINVPGVVIVESTSPTAVSIGNKAQVGAWASGVPVPDPLGGLIGPSVTDATGHPLPNYGSFVLGGNSKGSYTINPGIYSQINVSGSANLTMNPGIYIIEGGGVAISGGASVTGTGVLIYNAGSNYPNSGGSFGGITLSGSGAFNLSAPNSGPYAGVLIFQSRQNTRALSISGSILTGLNGTIYAPSALLSLSGDAQLQSLLDVGMLNVSGGAALTQIAAGSDGTGDTSGIANTLLARNLSVYINDPSGLFTSDALARIQDAINAWDAILGPYNVTITEVSDPTLANIVIDTGSTSAAGGAAAGVLGCYNAPNAEITILQGWNWYAGSDPSRIGANQYDFETTVLHELGHALGLGGATNPRSPMYEVLAAGVADRTVTTQDLNIPDPPAGADPQMAAESRPGPAVGLSAPHAAVAPAAVLGPGPVPGPPLPVLSSPQWSAAGDH
jgi:streptogramin lyase